MRIATWNLAARRTPAHEQLLTSLCADVLLLTEVHVDTQADARSAGTMELGQSYAAVRGADATSTRSAWSAAGTRGGVTFVSSVLPWRIPSQARRTVKLVRELDDAWPEGHVVWGGDWNHELQGRLWVGSKEGRAAIADLLERRNMVCPTVGLPARKGDRSIDHIAVPSSWRVTSACVIDCASLSDHDAYVVEVLLPTEVPDLTPGCGAQDRSGWAIAPGSCGRSVGVSRRPAPRREAAHERQPP